MAGSPASLYHGLIPPRSTGAKGGTFYGSAGSTASAKNLHHPFRRQPSPSPVQRQFFRRVRGIRGHYGRIRLRQNHAFEYSGSLGPSHRRRRIFERQGAFRYPGAGSGRFSPVSSGLCLSGLQSAGYLFSAGQHLSPPGPGGNGLSDHAQAPGTYRPTAGDHGYPLQISLRGLRRAKAAQQWPGL